MSKASPSTSKSAKQPSKPVITKPTPPADVKKAVKKAVESAAAKAKKENAKLEAERKANGGELPSERAMRLTAEQLAKTKKVKANGDAPAPKPAKPVTPVQKEDAKARYDRIVAEAKEKAAKPVKSGKASQPKQEPAMSTPQKAPTVGSTQPSADAALLELANQKTQPKVKVAKTTKKPAPGEKSIGDDLLGPDTSKKVKTKPKAKTEEDDLLGAPAKSKAISPVRAAFAAKFAGGDKLKYLAFRASTSIRSAKDGPCTKEELAERLDVSMPELEAALDYLLKAKTITAAKKGSVVRYSFVPPALR